jgi:hypothetical protein
MGSSTVDAIDDRMWAVAGRVDGAASVLVSGRDAAVHPGK